MVILPKVRGFICTTAHPEGCAYAVDQQIDFVRAQPTFFGPKRVLILGSSTGYGLASRISLAFGAGAQTLGVAFERGAAGKRTGSAGWYNSAAFEMAAKKHDIYAKTIMGDAFSEDISEKVMDLIAKDFGQIDCLVYSLAAPRRTDPTTGETYSSVLKPIGQTYTNKTVDTMTGEVKEVSIDPATDQEIDHTIKVMGGEDWQRWVHLLMDRKLLADNFKTVAYSYIGPELTYPIYTNGTIGQAKKHLQQTAVDLSERLKPINGEAIISVNKALVTQSSSAIPVVPLYISILSKLMEERGTDENCIQQMYRLFSQYLYSGKELALDTNGRIRLDDLEMNPQVQQEIMELWQRVNTENLVDLANLTGYQEDFYRLFGFGFKHIDYNQDIEPNVLLPSEKECE